MILFVTIWVILIYFVVSYLILKQKSYGSISTLNTVSLLCTLPFALVVKLIQLVFNLFFPSKSKVYISISIDGDLCNSKKESRLGIKLTKNLLSKYVLPKHITWFINEGLYNWSSEYKKELNSLKAYDLQLHSHFIELEWNKSGKKPSSNKVKLGIAAEKKKLEKMVGKVTGFRAGKHILNNNEKVLKALGFTYDCSEYPGISRFEQSGSHFDDSSVPFARNVYVKNGIIKLPAHLFFPPKTFIQTLFLKKPIIISHFFHPYELVSRGKANNKTILALNVKFFLLNLFFTDAVFMSASKLVKKFEENKL